MPTKPKRALYPGTFDPLTLGHLDLIRRGLDLFGSLTVGIAQNAAKSPVLSVEERLDLLRKETVDIPGVSVTAFDGLVVEYCRRENIEVILRGLRTISDFEYEYQMALTNRFLGPEVETVFVMPNEKYSYISSRLIREILAAGGDVSAFLPTGVEQKLRAKLKGK